MIPDNLDIFIFKTIFEAFENKKEVTNWDIAKLYAKTINEKDVDKLFERIKARMKKYCCHGIFFKSKNGEGTFIYNMDLEKITFIKHKFNDGYKQCLLLRMQE